MSRQKSAHRCHWCFPHVEVVDVSPEQTDAEMVRLINCNEIVPMTTQTTWTPEITSAPEYTWSKPFTLRLLTDSVGRLKSNKKDYINDVRAAVASAGIVIVHDDKGYMFLEVAAASGYPRRHAFSQLDDDVFELIRADSWDDVYYNEALSKPPKRSE